MLEVASADASFEVGVGNGSIESSFDEDPGLPFLPCSLISRGPRVTSHKDSSCVLSGIFFGPFIGYQEVVMLRLNNWSWDSGLYHSAKLLLLLRYIIVVESIPSLGCFNKVLPIPRILGIHLIDLFFVMSAGVSRSTKSSMRP